MEDYIIIAVVAVIVTLAVFYIYKAKKSGKRCIGCPSAGTCNSKTCGGNCSNCKKHS